MLSRIKRKHLSAYRISQRVYVEREYRDGRYIEP
jgi:hypothetical protein